MKKYLSILGVLLFLNSVPSKVVLAWSDDSTHKDISSLAARNSILSNGSGNYMANLGYSEGLGQKFNWNTEKTVEEWLQDGAELEDASGRPLNHFHNPLLPWSQAGLHVLGLPLIGESTVLWSQDWNAQATWSSSSNLPFEGTITVDGTTPTDWSWRAVRNNYYLAATATSSSVRSEYFARMFFGLGHQVHLLQDMSVPMHVRNNQHLINRMIEKYVVDHRRAIMTDVASAQVPMPSVPLVATINDLAPVARLFDSDGYTGAAPIAMSDTSFGIAEWTNANFFSDDTINLPSAHGVQSTGFPYPNFGDTNLVDVLLQNAPLETIKAVDGAQDTGVWVKKINASNQTEIVHFAKFGYTSIPITNIVGDTPLLGQTFILDNECYKDYAGKLLPRAVGYSAALLDYFFRGTITIHNLGVMAVADGNKSSYLDDGNEHQQFKELTAWMENTTPNGELIGDGYITAVARYKIAPNYDAYLSNYPPDTSSVKDYTYSVSSAIKVDPGDFEPGYYSGFTFNFSGNPIPAGITDLTLQVVFKGTIGNETGNAVAVGMSDIMEPTHFTVWNLTDMFPLVYSGSTYMLYTFDQIKEKAQQNPSLLDKLDTTNDGTLDDEPYLKPSTSTYTISFWDGWSWNPAAVTEIPAGKHIRIIALAGAANNYAKIQWEDAVSPGSRQMQIPGVVNQAGQTAPTPVYTFRNGYGEDGQTLVPSRQHEYFGTLRCLGEDITANGYCPYPSETALPVSLTPIPFTSLF